MLTKTNYPHRPPHIFDDNTLYFMTASTLNHVHILKPIGHKEQFQRELFELAPQFGLDLHAWVILDNHYHLLCYLADGLVLPNFIKKLHRRTAIYFNQQDKQPGRKVWYNYWDRYIRGERDYWQRFNYIHYNPIKHGYVQKLRDWPFSSLLHYLESEGLEWLDDCWRRYSVKEVELEDDDF
jgi:putative transposase